MSSTSTVNPSRPFEQPSIELGPFELRQQAPPPTTSGEPSPSVVEVPLGAPSVDLVRSGADTLREFGGPDVLGNFDEVASGLGRVAQFSDHLYGEPQYAQTTRGRTAAAAVDTAFGEAADNVVGGAIREAIGARPATLLGVVGAVDSVLEVDDAPKILTTLVSDLDPTSLVTGAGSLLVDLGSVGRNAFRDPELAAQQLAQVDEESVSGRYGGAIQGFAIAGNLIADPSGTAERVAGSAAEQGELGVLPAWGNAAADLMHDALHGENREARIIPVAEAERRETFWGALFE